MSDKMNRLLPIQRKVQPRRLHPIQIFMIIMGDQAHATVDHIDLIGFLLHSIEQRAIRPHIDAGWAGQIITRQHRATRHIKQMDDRRLAIRHRQPMGSDGFMLMLGSGFAGGIMVMRMTGEGQRLNSITDGNPLGLGTGSGVKVI